jgi:predicted nucleic acid-binding protein
MPFVVDASVTLTWFFPDEATTQTESLLRQLEQQGASAPAVWPLEVANALIVAERRGRIVESDTAQFLRTLENFEVEVYPHTPNSTPSLVGVARDHGLTVYDSSYLELAARLDLPLATADNRLRQVAERIGVAVRP